jgi:predicted SPOUT superfamily RNA methylase MTH1
MSGILNVVQSRFRDPLTTKTLSIANDFIQLKKIQASDAEAGDNFGHSVSVSDTRIVVGAPFEDTGATGAGSAYIFDINGNQLAKIQASDAEQYDGFGTSVAVSDNRIVVGAPGEGNQSGSAYIFDINGNQLAKIQASDAEQFDYFGYSVAASDTRIVVGAYQEDTTATDAGSAYIFDINGNQLAKIQASDAEASDRFGYSVAVSNTRIVVGAWGEDTTASAAGSVYIFDIDGNQIAKIQASDAEASDRFGYSVAVSDTRIVVGAYLEDTAAGSAYIFDIDGNQLAKIQASDAEANDNFGVSVAVSDTRIVVGAHGESTIASAAGSAYIFDINGNELAKIQASDAEQYDRFGRSVAVSDTRIVVGAYFEDTTADDAGSAYIFMNFHNDYDSIPWEKIRLKYTGDVE